jgi:tight adherence protein B
MGKIMLGLGIFLFSVIIIQLIVYAYGNMRSTQRKKIRKRLRKHVYIEQGGGGGTEILKSRVYSDIPFLNQLIKIIPGIHSLDNLVIQANAKGSFSVYILTALIIGITGLFITNTLIRNLPFATLLSVMLSSLPFIYLTHLKRKRTKKFKKQFPDGLDLIARALKAGHAFSGGMQLAADEFEDPLGPEFAEALEEINFGISVSDALKNMAQRIDCIEVRYFVVGVILQRETGGNLAELIQTLAMLIREKIKFQGKVRTLSAEGRLSGIVLACLPIVFVGIVASLHPSFFLPLITDPIGKILIVAALVLTIIGAFIIKEMVTIEV